ncbi:hypothetical protein CkaCkLH20_13106 [Colletotrichum karsti]|uniref:Tat pathway signal sequence n=1 Tax=Colletotrichum karsti TaxID=1095194 RepID=A0A9P6HSQ4_9PEZI|nr:uncharacterized protein CkaCkLH20_13106 [Colletotrichum karsti]KAF9869389.1 hypothetical protein CkaCkLH20_13106 [Colletotrichum karsti]
MPYLPTNLMRPGGGEPVYHRLPIDETGLPRKEARRPDWPTLVSVSAAAFIAGGLMVGVVLLQVNGSLHVQECNPVSPEGTFGEGFRTDFGPAKQHIELQEVNFTGTPHVTDDGFFFIPTEESKYVGEPTDEMDEAWEKLIGEAYDAWGPQHEQFWNQGSGGYYADFEMLHMLHCVNQIRKLFAPERYPMVQSNRLLVHRDHCLNSLREHIMCKGDLTPLPTKWTPGIQHNYIEANRPHICRNFQKLRAFATNRKKGPLAVSPDFEQKKGSLPGR